MKTQEQQEEHGFYIISTMEVTKEYDEKTKTEKLKKAKVVTHLSFQIEVPGKKTIMKGFYPKTDDDIKNSINTLKSLIVKSEGEYVDDAKRLELAREWDALYPDDPASHIKKIPFTKEEVLKAYDVAEERLKNPGTYDLQSSNCVHEVQEVYQGVRQGSFTDHYTIEELAQKMPGLTMSVTGRNWMEGPFPASDKPHQVLSDLSLEAFAKKHKIPVERLSVTENTGPVGKPNGLVLSNPPKNIITIAPNPEIVASAASQEVLTPIQHDDESMEKLAVALGQGLYLFEDGALKKSYGKGLAGKPIAVDYNSKQGKYKDLMRDGHPLRRSVVYLPLHEAIASGTEGRYTAQDLIELQRSNFQAITDTSQESMMASDGDKKPAFDQNSTPSTASDSEEEQQHSVQQNTRPLDPEYKEFLSTLMALSLHPSFLKQVEERNVMDSEEAWRKAGDAAIQAAMARIEETEKTSKVKSIIEAALKAFKEKFEAIRDKFTKKLKDDIEKTAKDASDSQQNGQAEYDAKAQAIHQQKAQEIEAMRGQLQSLYESQVAEIAERKKGEIDAFFQQGQAECDAVFAARSGAASNQPSSSSGLALSYVVSNSDVVAQKNAELSTFKAQKSAEMEAEQQALLAQTQNQLNSFRASKEAEAAQQCNALKSSIEQRLKSTESKVREIAEAAQTKDKAQVAECNRKIRDIQEDTGLIERLKEVIGNSGDVEALINEELNVVLQGAASDFGVDAEIL